MALQPDTSLEKLPLVVWRAVRVMSCHLTAVIIQTPLALAAMREEATAEVAAMAVEVEIRESAF